MSDLDIRDTFPPFVRKAMVASRNRGVIPGATGRQLVFRFENGYGASVINGHGSYARFGEGELAVAKYHGPGDDDWDITHDTPITSDVIPGVDAEGLVSLLVRISKLPAHREIES